MITQENINTARRLLATYDAANAARIAKDRKAYVAWQREAKPLAGFDVRSRPVGGLVHKILAERVAAFDQEERASLKPDTLPTLPDTITIHLPPGLNRRMGDLAAAHYAAQVRAARGSYQDTIATLRKHEKDLLAKARRQAAWFMDEDVVLMLDIAAALEDAVHLIETHVAPDQDNG